MDASDIFKKRCELIANVELFKGCSKNLIKEISISMKEQSFSKGTYIVRQGDNSQMLYFILKGRTKVFMNNADGDQTVFSFLSKGDYFGEKSLFDNDPRSASVITTEDTSVLCLSQSDFKTLFHQYPDLCKPIFKALTAKIRRSDEVICNLTCKNIHQRLWYRIRCEAKKMPDGRLMTSKITQQDLADMVGSSREMVSRVLKQFKDEGLIEINQKKITLLEGNQIRRAS